MRIYKKVAPSVFAFGEVDGRVNGGINIQAAFLVLCFSINIQRVALKKEKAQNLLRLINELPSAELPLPLLSPAELPLPASFPLPAELPLPLPLPAALPLPLPSALLPFRAESADPGERRLPRLSKRSPWGAARATGAGVGAAATEAARAMKAVAKMVLESIVAVLCGCSVVVR